MVQKCLAECTRLNVKGISIPSIGAGNLKYPYDVVAKALIEEAASYLVNNKGKTSLELVHFVIFDKEVHNAFEIAYKKVSTSAKSAYTTAKSKASSTQTLSHQDKFTSRCSFSLPHGLQLDLLRGDISCNESDVVVNSTNENLRLVGSGVAGALLEKGGPELQAACDAVVAQGIRATEGKVVVTPATGNLRCNAIFHVAFHSKEEKIFVKTIQACLDMAEKKKYKSIAFPAVGTGTHGYPPSGAAKAVVEALKKFTSKKPKHVKVIQMVVFQSDVYEKFVSAFKSMEESNGGILNFLYSGVKAISSAIFGYNEEMHEKDSDKENFDEEASITEMLSTLPMDSEVVIHIYGETDHAVNRAEKRLRATIDTQFVNEDIIDLNITALSDSTVIELKDFAKSHNVDIDIDRDPSLHSIKLHGCLEDVLRVKDKVRDATFHLNQEKSKQVAADVVYKTIRWMRLTPNEEEVEYGEDLNYEIEQAYQNNQKVFTSTRDNFYINFDKMEEKDMVLDEVVKVKRVDFSKGIIMIIIVINEYIFKWKIYQVTGTQCL